MLTLIGLKHLLMGTKDHWYIHSVGRPDRPKTDPAV